MNEEKKVTTRIPVVSLESVVGVKIPWSEMEKIVRASEHLKDGESANVWKVAVQRMGYVVRVVPQVPKACPKCNRPPEYWADGRKKCVIVRCGACGRTVEGPNAVEAVFEWNEQAEDVRTGSVVEEGNAVLRMSEAWKIESVLREGAAFLIGLEKASGYDAEVQILRIRMERAWQAMRKASGVSTVRLCNYDDMIALYESCRLEDFRLCVEHRLWPRDLDEMRAKPAAYLAAQNGDTEKLSAAVRLLDDIGAAVPAEYRERK